MRSWTGILGFATGLYLAAAAAAQPVNPVYVDDSPVARETLARVSEFEVAGNEGEAVRELQRLLDEQPDRLVPEPGQGNLFVSVRTQVHRKLLSSPKLLERYRESETARARKELEAGKPESVERSRLLTLPGFEAALRVGQSHLEAAEFEAARATLEQLREHPDRRTPEGAALNKDAARLMSLVASYTGRSEVWALADAWSAEAGLAKPSREQVEAPASLRLPRSDFVTGTQTLDAEGVPTRPLWSSSIDPPGVTRDSAGPGEEAPEEHARSLYIFPTVVGDCVYVNDGTYITARDRFTLQPRWTHRPLAEEEDDAGARRAALGRVGPRFEDSCSVTVQGRILVATTGLLTGGSREGIGRTYALDTSTGKVLWSFIPPDLDPSLDGAAVRGPAMIDGGTIVLVMRKGSQGRRMTALYLAGVSLDTGTMKWVRPIGSAGALPFRSGDSRTDHAAVLHDGIVYCVDRLGVMAAVEAATGRPVWVRRMPVAAANMPYGAIPDASLAVQWDSPILLKGEMITLSPDRSELLVMEAATGKVTARRAATELGSPAYLVKVGDRLGAVTQDSVCFVPLSDPDKGVVTTTRTFGAPGIRGRVIASGDRLLIPRSDGLAVIDPATPNTDASVLRLERIGNVLPMQNQLLVIDAANLHSFVTWTVAQRLLEERMTANPADPDPAITYGELAFRSQHPEQIAPAVDKAIAALERNPSSEANRLARLRLFDVLREMVEASEDGWSPREVSPPARAAPVPQPGRRRTAAPQAVRPPPVEVPVLNPTQLAPVVERWGRIAQTPEERAAHLIALGRLCEAQGQPGAAAEAYQRILGDRQLAAALWRKTGMSVRAEIEATRRTRQLVMENGPAIYAAFEAQAAHDLEALGPGATPEDLERLARQYPVAAAAVGMWARCAELHEKAGRKHATISMLREALAAAEAVQAAGVTLDPTLMGEIGGRLAVRLQQLDQVFAAAQLVARLRARHPDLALLDHGSAINTEALASGLMTRLSGLRRLPRVGIDIQPGPQALVGWVIMQPWSKEQIGRPCEHVMLVAPGESKVALWGLTGTGQAEGGTGALQQLWTREYKGSPPRLYRIDPESVFLFWDHGSDGAMMERIDAVSGVTRWKTEPFRTLFPADPAFDQRLLATRNMIDTPLDGAVKLTDIALTMDEQVLAMVERSGRVAAFDPATGKLLWKGATAVQQVHDADVGGGVLVIGGQAGQLAGGPENLIAAIDSRTGEMLHRLDQLDGRVRWVRVAGGRFPADGARAVMVAGLDVGVTCYDLERGKTNWNIPGNQAVESRDAWIYGDRLFLLDDSRSLWLASISTGKIVDKQLETFEHLVGSGAVQGFAMGPNFSQTAFSTDRGVCVFDESGRLIGIDSLESGEADEGGLLPPVAAQDCFVAVETTPADGPGNRSLYKIHTLDTKSAMLRATRQLSLELPPRRIALLDGRIIITAGTNTIVYSAPEQDR